MVEGALANQFGIKCAVWMYGVKVSLSRVYTSLASSFAIFLHVILVCSVLFRWYFVVGPRYFLVNVSN